MALQPAPTLLRQKRSTHQAHVMIGARTFAASDPRRWSLYLLNNILGGPGMNSRLNLSLRERRGLVYTVESTMATYSDTGLWAIYFGCDQADVTRCRRLAERELCRLAERPLSESQLRQAKQQLHGQLAIAADNREQFTLDLVKSYLHEDRVRKLESVLAHVDGLTARQLQQAASELFDTTKTTTLIYE
jgi:predicted Zn-dependent peptidase